MQDLYQIVDDQDVVIGAKPRNEIDYINDCYRVSALWLTNSKKQILIAQRLATKDKDPGKWGPAVAGTVEVDETYESNIYKEAKEEIGLTDVHFALGPKIKYNSPRNYYCQWFTAKCDTSESEFVLQPTEVEQVRWIDLLDLLTDMQTYPDKYVPSLPVIIDKLYG